MMRQEFAGYNLTALQKDLLAGITVAAVALPLALAFGVASGADAAAGLVTAVIAGIVIGFLGGSPYQISGPTGAMSAVLIVLATRYGLEGVWLASLLAGIMILLLGIFHLGRAVALIPSPVIAGFTSGIAVIIAFGQIDNFLGIQAPASENILHKLSYYANNPITPNYQAIITAVLVIAVMFLWPLFKRGQRLPGSLLGIALATLLVTLAGWDVPTIGNIPATIILEKRLLPSNIPWEAIPDLIIPAMSIAALGAIESLLCGAVAGNMTSVRLHNNIELVAQGLGNILTPFFGGVPATAAIARTSVGIKSGAATRLTSVIHGLMLLMMALVAGKLIGRIPLSALAGVLIVTAWRMNEWHTIRFYFDHRLKHAVIAFTFTLVATVLLDLTQAILIGFGISTLIFMGQMSILQITRRPVEADRLPSHMASLAEVSQKVAVYYLSGPLFFAAARQLIDYVEAHDGPDSILILSIRGVPLADATGVEVLRELHHRQQAGGGDLLLTSLDARVESLLRRSEFLDELGADRLFWSADLAIKSLGARLKAKDEPAQTDPTAEGLIESVMIAPFSETMGKKADDAS